jgi:3-dehydro-4-phosphotetronate decarboxylase
MRERDELVAIARPLYLRGYTFGTAGNSSVRIGDRLAISPTNSSFAELSPETLAGPQPSPKRSSDRRMLRT